MTPAFARSIRKYINNKTKLIQVRSGTTKVTQRLQQHHIVHRQLTAKYDYNVML